MIPKDWLEVAQLLSSVAAACGLFLAAVQVRRARMTGDLQSLEKFFEGVFEREAALAKAADDADKQRHAFNVLLDFLEVYASAHNKKLFGRGSEEMVRHKLEDSIIELEAATEWHPLIGAALDRSTTFIELRRFIEKHRAEVEGRRAERALHKSAQSSVEA